MKLETVVILLAAAVGVYLVGTTIANVLLAFLAPLHNFLTIAV